MSGLLDKANTAAQQASAEEAAASATPAPVKAETVTPTPAAAKAVANGGADDGIGVPRRRRALGAAFCL